MRISLQRYVAPLSVSRLPDVLSGASAEVVEPVGLTADFTEVFQVISRLVATDQGGEERRRSHWDAELAEPLHTAMRGLQRRQATDMRLWHWLCTNPAQLRTFVWHRWRGAVPVETSDAMRPSLAAHFLGRASLNGFSRNALARIYLCAETLHSEEDGYELVRRALGNTDLYSGIFERKLGLAPAAARAAVRALDHPGIDHRPSLLRLNHVATTLALECMSGEEVSTFLSGPRHQG